MISIKKKCIASKVAVFIGLSVTACAPSQYQSKIALKKGNEAGAANQMLRVEEDYQFAKKETHLKTGEELIAKQESFSDGVDTLKFQHFYSGIEVIGSMAMVHRTEGEPMLTNGLAVFDVDTKPTLSAQEAKAIAAAEGEILLGEPSLRILPSKADDSARLIWIVELQSQDTLSGKDVLIDAHDGILIAEVPHETEIVAHTDVIVFEANKNPNCAQGVNVIDAWSCSEKVKNDQISRGATPSARSAAVNAKKALEYYNSEHSWESFDGKSSPLVSVVHVGDHFENAYWMSKTNIMAYGEGNPSHGTASFTRALDVAGHELTHGVFNNIIPKDIGQSGQMLLYSYGEFGAINEALADYFGVLIAGNNDWELGKDIFLRKGTAIRNIANPSTLTFSYLNPSTGERSRKAYPKKYSDRMDTSRLGCRSNNDYCWVHANSTVISHAIYEIHQTLGQSKTEKVVFHALQHYITPGADFIELRQAVENASLSLYGAKGTETRKITEIFDDLDFPRS